MDNQSLFINPNSNIPAPKKWWQTKKVLFVIVGLIVLAEVLWSLYSLSKSSPKLVQKTEVQNNQQPSPAPKTPATMSLLGPSKVRLNEDFKVEVRLSVPETSADGVDLIIKYDPKLLDVVNLSSPMTVGTIYPAYPVNSVDQALGEIIVSGTSSLDSNGFTGQGILGSISFKAKKLGQTSISLVFDKNSTQESNIVETKSGHDILEMVENLELSVSN